MKKDKHNLRKQELEQQLNELRDRLEETITKLQQQEARAKATAEWEAEWRELRRREVAALELAATSLQGLGPMLSGSGSSFCWRMMKLGRGSLRTNCLGGPNGPPVEDADPAVRSRQIHEQLFGPACIGPDGKVWLCRDDHMQGCPVAEQAKHAARITPEQVQKILDKTCPGPDCPMCSGEMCNLCGAGCWSSETSCEHDCMQRHEDAKAGET